MIYMANTHTDEIFNVYGALDNLNKRMKIVEEKVPNYTADMLEVYRNFGALTKRIAELENLINKETTTLKRGEEMKNKMIGNYSNEGVLNISATNLQEFESLIKKAKKQADELQDTINQLEFFNFSFKFSTDKDN